MDWVASRELVENKLVVTWEFRVGSGAGLEVSVVVGAILAIRAAFGHVIGVVRAILEVVTDILAIGELFEFLRHGRVLVGRGLQLENRLLPGILQPRLVLQFVQIVAVVGQQQCRML